jgi:heme-degrading monooxygenase HmoA
MIARVWCAQTTPIQGPAYAQHLRKHVLPAIRAMTGYVAATLLERRLADAVEITVITYWRSVEAIRDFAGADIEEAVVADEAIALLSRYDRRVRHYDVIVQDGTIPSG